MKAFLVPLLYSALLSGASLAFGETAAGTASPAAAAPAEKIPSAESLINQAFSFAINIQQTLAGVQDKESADNAVKTLQDIQKDIRHFLQLQDKLNDAEKEKEDALIEKMKKRMEMLDNRCRQEGKRLFEARYYGSAALKDILENSDEFSDLVEPPLFSFPARPFPVWVPARPSPFQACRNREKRVYCGQHAKVSR